MSLCAAVNSDLRTRCSSGGGEPDQLCQDRVAGGSGTEDQAAPAADPGAPAATGQQEQGG